MGTENNKSRVNRNQKVKIGGSEIDLNIPGVRKRIEGREGPVEASSWSREIAIRNSSYIIIDQAVIIEPIGAFRRNHF